MVLVGGIGNTAGVILGTMLLSLVRSAPGATPLLVTRVVKCWARRMTDLTDARVLALPDGADLALSRGTDFFHVGDLLDERERAVVARVREYCDAQVAPVANDFWERAEFPLTLVAGYRELHVAGGTMTGHGCPSLSAVAEGLVAAELARGDGSIATFNAVHSGLAMTAIGLLGSPEQQARWLPAMAAVDKLGAFALTEPEHGSDVVRLATRARMSARSGKTAVAAPRGSSSLGDAWRRTETHRASCS